MEFDKEVLKGYIDSIVLSTLYDENLYGYLIAKKIKRISEEEFELKESTLYVSLKRLEKKGFLKGYWNDTEGTSGGRRRYYSITEIGKEFFIKSIGEWDVLKRVLNNFMGVRLYEEDRGIY